MKKSAKREKKPAAPENEKNLSGKGFFYENRKFRNVVETHSWVDSSNKTSLISELVVI